MGERTHSTSSKHVAGIIPVSGLCTDIDSFFPNSMLPIGNGFYSIQRSVVECSYAGCDTIWIVCTDKEAPLIKSVCGDFVLNLHDYDHAKYSKYPKDNRRTVPIFYVPLSYKHQTKKGLGVAIVDGISACFHASSKISKWIVPNKYYVSSPYGVYKPQINKIRGCIANNDSFFLTCEGNSALTGHHLGFSLGIEQVKHVGYLFKRMDPKTHFSVDKILNNDIVKKQIETLEIDNYNNIQNWNEYVQMWRNPLSILPQYRYCFDVAFKKQERKLND